jgi:thiamine-monophosphate kinase
MRVDELGEFGLISRLSSLINKKSDKKAEAWNDLMIGIGDDTAAWISKKGMELITTDVLVEGTHFDLAYTGWRDLGWKSIAINISDIYAMGGKPQYALISLCLPGAHDVTNIIQMYEGMISICNKYGIAIAGGNIAASEKLVVNITLTGTVGTEIMTRSTARPGDLIAVSGFPGLSAAGLKLMKAKAVVSEQAAKLFRKAHLHPELGLNSGPDLASCGVTAAIDTSDGLLSDLGHICEASVVSAVIYEQNLPVHPLLRKYFKKDYLDMVLTGGEDYKLLFTAAHEVMETVINSIKPTPTIIGEIIPGKIGKISVMDATGKPIKFNYQGWDHYKRQSTHE